MSQQSEVDYIEPPNNNGAGIDIYVVDTGKLMATDLSFHLLHSTIISMELLDTSNQSLYIVKQYDSTV